MSDQEPPQVTNELTAFLLERYGPLIGHEALAKILSFANTDAFERSVQRGHIGLNLVRLPGRRGMFALATDVARYLIDMTSREGVSPLAARSETKQDQPKT